MYRYCLTPLTLQPVMLWYVLYCTMKEWVNDYLHTLTHTHSLRFIANVVNSLQYCRVGPMRKKCIISTYNRQPSQTGQCTTHPPDPSWQIKKQTSSTHLSPLYHYTLHGGRQRKQRKWGTGGVGEKSVRDRKKPLNISCVQIISPLRFQAVWRIL